MKYKNIGSAIHNFAHNFTSLTNYVDGDYVADELHRIRAQGKDIEVDWLTGEFKPAELVTPRIDKSVRHYRETVAEYFLAHNIDPKAVVQLKLEIPARGRPRIVALDTRGKEHKVYVSR